MRELARRCLQKICDLLELLVAILVLVGLLDALVGYFLGFTGIFHWIVDTEQFLTFLGNMFNVVVGIEFVKMLLKPSAENVIEVLTFLIGRHMIIGDNAAADIFLSVISVAILYLLRRFLQPAESRQTESSSTWGQLRERFKSRNTAETGCEMD